MSETPRPLTVVMTPQLEGEPKVFSAEAAPDFDPKLATYNADVIAEIEELVHAVSQYQHKAQTSPGWKMWEKQKPLNLNDTNYYSLIYAAQMTKELRGYYERSLVDIAQAPSPAEALRAQFPGLVDLGSETRADMETMTKQLTEIFSRTSGEVAVVCPSHANLWAIIEAAIEVNPELAGKIGLLVLDFHPDIMYGRESEKSFQKHEPQVFKSTVVGELLRLGKVAAAAIIGVSEPYATFCETPQHGMVWERDNITALMYQVFNSITFHSALSTYLSKGMLWGGFTDIVQDAYFHPKNRLVLVPDGAYTSLASGGVPTEDRKKYHQIVADAIKQMFNAGADYLFISYDLDVSQQTKLKQTATEYSLHSLWLYLGTHQLFTDEIRQQIAQLRQMLAKGKLSDKESAQLNTQLNALMKTVEPAIRPLNPSSPYKMLPTRYGEDTEPPQFMTPRGLSFRSIYDTVDIMKDVARELNIQYGLPMPSGGRVVADITEMSAPDSSATSKRIKAFLRGKP